MMNMTDLTMEQGLAVMNCIVLMISWIFLSINQSMIERHRVKFMECIEMIERERERSRERSESMHMYISESGTKLHRNESCQHICCMPRKIEVSHHMMEFLSRNGNSSFCKNCENIAKPKSE